MHKEIIQLLNEKRLKEAFTQIKEAAGTLNNWELKSQIESQQTTYEYMLHAFDLRYTDVEEPLP